MKTRTRPRNVYNLNLAFDAYHFEDKFVVPVRARPKLVLVLVVVVVLGSKGL